MSGSFHLKDFARRISLDAATTWLRRNGWTIVPDQHGSLLCQGPSDDAGNPITCRLPCEEGYADYELRLEDLVATLSKTEERPAIEIIGEMAAMVATEEEKPISDPPSIDDLIGIIERSIGGELSAKRRQQIVDDLTPILTNAEIATGQTSPSEKMGGLYELALTQETAMVAVRLTARLRTYSDARLAIWRICETLLGSPVSLTSSELDEMYSIAESDDPNVPEKLSFWLQKNSSRAIRLEGQEDAREH